MKEITDKSCIELIKEKFPKFLPGNPMLVIGG